MFTRDLFPILNTMTKYPSIPTFHALGERGVLTDQKLVVPDGELYSTEKIDGTNARIIFDFDGDYLIGSRENLLYAKGDRIGDPAQGIVQALVPLADRLSAGPCRRQVVFYGEVFGGRTTGCKSYGDAVRFRLFDMMDFNNTLLNESIARGQSRTAEWRDSGGQPFYRISNTAEFATECGVEMVPLAPVPPMSGGITDIHQWLGTSMMSTRVGDGPAEGVVVRNAARSFICKIRHEDYRRSTRVKPSGVSA